MKQKLTVTTKTKAQIKAEFAQAFKNIQPLKTGPVTQKDRLEPYREQIMQQRRRGLNWRQIAEGMAPPPINEVVSEKLLRAVFGHDEASVIPIPAQPAPLRRMVLDPVTGQPVVVPPPPAPPMTPQEQAKYGPIVQELVPAIVKAKMARTDALAYARLASERLRPKEVDRFMAIVESTLDNLTEATSAGYALTPDVFATWKKRWV